MVFNLVQSFGLTVYCLVFCWFCWVFFNKLKSSFENKDLNFKMHVSSSIHFLLGPNLQIFCQTSYSHLLKKEYTKVNLGVIIIIIIIIIIVINNRKILAKYLLLYSWNNSNDIYDVWHVSLFEREKNCWQRNKK